MIQGYKKRQALYSCLTCVPDAKNIEEVKLAGVCLACSLECHEGHELYELYTKVFIRTYFIYQLNIFLLFSFQLLYHVVSDHSLHLHVTYCI